MSFWGAIVITSLTNVILIVRNTIATWLWGGFFVDNATLNRFFGPHYLPNYYLFTCLPIYYLLIYLFVYLLIDWFIYLPTYLLIYLPTYLPIYLVKYPLTYLWKKLKFKCCYTHSQKNSLKSKKHVKWIWYDIVLQSDVTVWWLKHWCGTKKTKV